MRVTKLIREYVEKRIAEAYPPLPAYNKTTVEEFEKKYEEVCNKAKENFANQVKELLQDYPTIVPDVWNFKTGKKSAEECWVDNFKSVRVGFDVNTFTTKDYLELSKKNEEIAKKRNAVKENILVSLELGANKQELENMLKNL